MRNCPTQEARRGRPGWPRPAGPETPWTLGCRDGAAGSPRLRRSADSRLQTSWWSHGADGRDAGVPATGFCRFNTWTGAFLPTLHITARSGGIPEQGHPGEHFIAEQRIRGQLKAPCGAVGAQACAQSGSRPFGTGPPTGPARASTRTPRSEAVPPALARELAPPAHPQSGAARLAAAGPQGGLPSRDEALEPLADRPADTAAVGGGLIRHALRAAKHRPGPERQRLAGRRAQRSKAACSSGVRVRGGIRCPTRRDFVGGVDEPQDTRFSRETAVRERMRARLKAMLQVP